MLASLAAAGEAVDGVLQNKLKIVPRLVCLNVFDLTMCCIGQFS